MFSSILLIVTNFMLLGMWVFNYKISQTPKEKKQSIIWIIIESILIILSIIDIFL